MQRTLVRDFYNILTVQIVLMSYYIITIPRHQAKLVFKLILWLCNKEYYKFLMSGTYKLLFIFKKIFKSYSFWFCRYFVQISNIPQQTLYSLQIYIFLIKTCKYLPSQLFYKLVINLIINLITVTNKPERKDFCLSRIWSLLKFFRCLIFHYF